MEESDVEDVRNNLSQLVAIFGEPKKVETYRDLANRLSVVARKFPQWSWRYVQSVHNGTIEPSAGFSRAVEILAAEVDGLPAFVAETEPVTVHARPGAVHPDAIVIGESKACANPSCNIHFIPRVPWQKYCPRCRKKKERE